MTGTSNITDLERSIAPEDRTPTVVMLLQMVERLQQQNRELQEQVLRQQLEIEQLRDEVDRLKGLPERPKRKPPQPSPLNDATGPPSQNSNQKNGGKRTRSPGDKRPGSTKRTRQITVHQHVTLTPDGLPDDARLIDYQDFTVQDLTIQANNTCYRRARYQLLDGSFVTAPLPEDVRRRGHFGPTLRAYVLYQHFHNQVTQPLLYEELWEFGIDISRGTISALLTEGHDEFHEEKDSLLPAAREVSSYLQTDDTSARHQGRPAHTLHIGNDLFATFFTTSTKSRVNFLQCLLTPYKQYTLNGDALFYLEYFDVPRCLLEKVRSPANQSFVCNNPEEWEQCLDKWEVTSPEQRRLLTEGALWASVLAQDLYTNTVLVSDDAAQFKVLGFFHSLCWVHQERHIARMIPLTEPQREAQEQVRDEIWNYYQRLKAYRESPTPQGCELLRKDFDRLFSQTTAWAELNESLLKIHARQETLLLVLEHPEIPLHNNLSENDIRQYVKKRKISAGTRSEAGRRARDTFLSLKTTCRKLGHSFWQYLQHRITGSTTFPPLGDLIHQKATTAES